jgi:transketolase
MAIEDIALMTALPRVAVIVPSDAVSTRALTNAMLAYEGPVYIRTGRPKTPVIYPDSTAFEIGKANQVRAGKHVTIVANGHLVARALQAAERLEYVKIEARVLDMHTVKPLDEETLLSAARETKGIVVAEEHLAHGGLGSAVAMFLAAHHPTPMRFVNLGDRFAESGKGDELMDKYGLSVNDIVRAAQALV